MPHSEDIPEANATRLMWREQLAALPRAAWYALRRLLCRESRYYLVIDGTVAARFTSDRDRWLFVTWLTQMHTLTYDLGIAYQRQKEEAQRAQQPDADAG